MYSGKLYPVMWSMLRVFSVIFPALMARKTISLFSIHDPGDFMKNISKEDIKTLLGLYRCKAYIEDPLIDIKSQPEAAVLNRIEAPALVAQSKEDKSVVFENAEYCVQNIRSAELYVSPTWSHFPWFGPHSEEELNKVISFLKS